MQTLKFVFNTRINADCNVSIQTEHIIDAYSDAYEAGKESKRMVSEFLRGYAEDEEPPES